MEQLEANLAGVTVQLDETQAAALDKVSTPTHSFPTPFLAMAPTIMHAGATVDGEPSEPWPMAPASDEERH